MFVQSWRSSKRVWSARALFAGALSLLALVILSACTVTTANTTGNGTLVVDWTLSELSAPAQCTAHGAQTIAIHVFDVNGIETGDVDTACSSLSAVIGNLPAGSYSIRAEALDANGLALASLAAPVGATINGDATTTETIDFSDADFSAAVAGTGSLTVSWTIAGTGGASLCASHNAQSMAIQVFNASNVQYGAPTVVACSALSVTIAGLPEGAYSIEAQMLDVNGASITSLVGPLPEIITSGMVTPQAIDFPEDSFGAVTTDPNAGSLTVTWTVAGVASASGCTDNGAANIVLQLFDATNSPVGDATPIECTTFSATLPSIAPGTYTLTAKLVDANGADLTTTATVPDIVISAALGTAQPLDFPTTSFLTSASGTGTINVTWTVAGSTALSGCEAHNAASIALQLYEADGVTPIGAALLDPCVAFTATITNLAPGSYRLSAQLVNEVETVSSLIPPQPLTVAAGGTVSQAFDFPVNSFN